MEHYDVDYIYDENYTTFNAGIGLLGDYIDYHMDRKITAEHEGNKALRYLSKRYMNSPYGKTGMRPNRINKLPYLDDDEVIVEPVGDTHE